MTSTLILYKQCKIREEKLFIVDDISSYLGTLTKETITAFQYQRQGMTLKVKLNKSQNTLNFTEANDYNYASIQNDTQKVCYYFIKSKKQLADSTIELELSMDTINTFRPSTDFEVSNKTKINRQHKDRIKLSRTDDKIGNKPYSNFPYLFDEFGHYTAPDTICEWFAEEENFGKICLFEISGSNYGGLIRATEIGDIPALKCYKVDKDSLEKTFICDCAELGQNNTDIVFLDENGDDVASIPSYEFEGQYLGVMVREDIESADDFAWENPFNFVWLVGGLGYGTFYYQVIGVLEKSATYQRIMDLYSEGINPILYGEEYGELTGDSNNWYLIYKDASLRCYLTNDNGFSVKIGGSNEITASDLAEGNYYYILPERNINKEVSLTIDDGSYVSALIDKNIFGVESLQIVTAFYKDGANIKVVRYWYDYIFGWRYDFKHEYTTTKIKILSNYDVVKANILTSLTNSLSAIRNGTNNDFNMTTTTEDVWAFSSLNRRDSTLVKIIKLPYRPTDENFSGWKYDSDSHMLYLDELEAEFQNSMLSKMNPLSALYVDGSLPAANKLRDDIYESKIYHSDYYQPKFVYDSFSFIFALERVNMENYVESANFNVIFRASNSINSRFLFSFPDYNVEGKKLEDYSNIMIVARNNDVPYYTDSYMQYIKTGFNYDVKSKERKEAGTWIGTGLALVGAIASFASSGVTGGFGVVGGISLATTAVGQLVNAVNTTAQAEANQAQKLLQLKQQQSSVASADDVDLMSAYTNNKAKWMLYRVSERMRKLLANLFFYTGYIDETTGVPNVNTRVRFNFLSCELFVVDDNNIPSEIMEDIKNKYNLGVTFLHHYNSEWDFSQLYENWETSLF